MTVLHVACLVMALGGQPAAARPRTVDLKFSSGLVWVTAQRATLAQILAAWSRAGRTKFEGMEKVPANGPIDVQLTGVSESEALAFLLRSAAGYTAVLRETADPVESTFARVLIVGSKASGAPAGTPGPEPPAEPSAPAEPVPVTAQPALGPDGLPIPDDQQDAPPFRSMPPGFSPPPDPPPPSGPNREQATHREVIREASY